MNIDKEIETLINTLRKDYNILGYVYNDDSKFIPGETPVYYSGPYWDNKEINTAVKALLIGKWLSSGENVRNFEKVFSRKFLTGNSLMVNSGSSANLVMLAALKKLYNWPDGAEVVVSSVGFPTTIAPIVQNNLTPIFADIEFDTLNFDLDTAFIGNPVAIFVSPVLGNPPNMDKILEICEEYNLLLILDNCDSLGTKWGDYYLNQLAIASSCSFYPAHHISTGEGGMISAANHEVTDIARSMAWWGRDCHCVGAENLLSCGICKNRFSYWLDDYDGIIDHKYVFTNIGYNLKPLDFQGAIGLEQLKKFDEIHQRRNTNKKIITDIFLKYLPELKTPVVLESAKPSWFGTPFICPSKEYKNKLVAYLEEKKIQTRNYFAGNILIHPGYKYLGNFKNYPNANKVLDLVFFVGCAPHYGENILQYFEDCLREYHG
jgi:CDP-6-deoxy-D-xylo-4-hexulose-3-dehydrase